MKTNWYMNPKLWTLAFMVLFGVLLLAAGVLTMGQEPTHTPANPPAAAGNSGKVAAGPAKAQAPDLPAVPLTPDEAKDLMIDQLKREKLELEIDRLTRQISDARTAQTKDSQALFDRLASAHKLDPEKYRLDPTKKAFVPLQK